MRATARATLFTLTAIISVAAGLFLAAAICGGPLSSVAPGEGASAQTISIDY